MTRNRSIFRLPDIEARELVPGLTGRFIHSDNMTVAYWSFDPDVAVPSHAHEHEQIVNVIEGIFDLTVAGETNRLQAGSAVVIPPHVEHSGRSITACNIVDIFYPTRYDFK